MKELFDDLMNGQDVWMIQCRGGLGFLDKASQLVRVPAEFFVQEFDRDFAIEFRVLREIDFTQHRFLKRCDNAPALYWEGSFHSID